MSHNPGTSHAKPPYRWRIVQYYQALAQVGGVFSAASLTLGTFLIGQWGSFAAEGQWRAVLILVISIVQLIAGSALMAYGIARLNRYPAND
ncbi:hypothetical protein [Microbacterium sp. bgisy203]|uniref:hypothetical protein n=1 Tax=Microbacterium sp. bgisy203 TaxID=3413799 RepID=UPI003D727AC6